MYNLMHEELDIPTGTRHILFPVHEIALSRKAFNWYAEHIARPGDKLFIVRILSQSIFNGHISSFFDQTGQVYGDLSSDAHLRSDLMKIVKELYTSFDQEILDLNKNLEGGSVSHIALARAHSHVGKALIEAERLFRIDLILMPTNDMISLKKALLGSISDYIFHKTTSAVAFVPAISNRRSFSQYQGTFNRLSE